MSRWRTLRSRRGAAILETAIALPVMVSLVLALYIVGQFYWTGTMLTTTADVATQSAMLAYDRARFPPIDPTAPDTNRTDAATLATRAADQVIASSATTASGRAIPDVSGPCAGLSAVNAGEVVGRRVVISPEQWTPLGAGNATLVNFQVQLSADWSLLGMGGCLRAEGNGELVRP